MSGVYAVTRHQLVTGGFIWTAGRYQACLVSAAYTPDFEADATMAAVPLAARLAPLLTLDTLTEDAGYCGAADLTWANLTTVGINALVISQVMTADPEQNRLVIYADEGDGFGTAANAVPVFVSFDPRGIWRP